MEDTWKMEKHELLGLADALLTLKNNGWSKPVQIKDVYENTRGIIKTKRGTKYVPHKGERPPVVFTQLLYLFTDISVEEFNWYKKHLEVVDVCIWYGKKGKIYARSKARIS